MAKKKSKKNAQKQVEVAAPPDNLEPTAEPATEDPPASEVAPEAEEQLLIPPPEAPGVDLPANDSTSIPEQIPGKIQDMPVKDEPPAEVSSTAVHQATTSLEPDHVDTNTLVAEEVVDELPARISTEEDVHIDSSNQPLATDTTMVLPSSLPGEDAAQPETATAQVPAIPVNFSAAVEGEVNSEPEEPNILVQPGDSGQVEVSQAEMPEAPLEPEQIPGLEQSNAETAVAMGPSEVLANMEPTTSATHVAAEIAQLEQYAFNSSFRSLTKHMTDRMFLRIILRRLRLKKMHF